MPALPPELNLVLTRGLSKRAQERFQSGNALVEALSIVARRHTIQPVGRSEIAALATSLQSSAGRPTIAVDAGGTPAAGDAPPGASQTGLQPATRANIPQPTTHGPKGAGLTPEELQALGLADQPTSHAPVAARPSRPESPPARPPQSSSTRRPVPPPAASAPAPAPSGPFTPQRLVLVGLFLASILLLYYIFSSIASGTLGPGTAPTQPPAAPPPTAITPQVPPTDAPDTAVPPTDAPDAQPTTPPTDIATPPPPPSPLPLPTNAPLPTEPPPSPTPIPPTPVPPTEVLPTDVPTEPPVPPKPTETPVAVLPSPTPTPTLDSYPASRYPASGMQPGIVGRVASRQEAVKRVVRS
jgi:hypothetical protein